MTSTEDPAVNFYNTTTAFISHTWNEKDHTERQQKIATYTSFKRGQPRALFMVNTQFWKYKPFGKVNSL